jgi:hypothetical protein
MAWDETAAISTVCPSGAARCTASLPSTPAAPGRFSTTSGWPSVRDICGASRRIMMSVAEPEAKGTTTRTGRDG